MSAAAYRHHHSRCGHHRQQRKATTTAVSVEATTVSVEPAVEADTYPWIPAAIATPWTVRAAIVITRRVIIRRHSRSRSCNATIRYGALFAIAPSSYTTGGRW